MVVIIHCVFFVIIAKHCICQANEASANESRTSIHELVTLTTTPRISDTKSIISDLNDTEQGISIESEINDTILFDNFLNVLLYVSFDQLKQVKHYIKSYYRLNEKEISNVDKIFNTTSNDFEYLLLYKLKQIVDAKKFNDSEEFMLDFMDESNYLIEKVLEYNFKKMNNRSMRNFTNWHGQSLKDKMLRQQVKISNTLVEMQMCIMLGVCKEKDHYSDYIIDWLRCLLSKDDLIIKEVFNAVPVVVDKYQAFIKTNQLFTKNMQYAAKSGPNAQRDVLDFMDETITNKDILKLIPLELKKCSELFKDLINAINEVYDLNDENYEELDNISYRFTSQSSNVTGIKGILNAIIKNMQMNFKGFPEEKQAKIKKIWFDITYL